jgi:cell division inhibitor SulA
MGAVIALDQLLDARTVWRGGAAPVGGQSSHPTGHVALDTRLPQGGWPANALTEVLIPADGVGELALVFPTLSRLTQAGQRVVLIAPPYRAHAPGWAHASVSLSHLQIVRAEARDALWATEQCLRSAACAAVLCWPQQADDRALRRLQVAAETGQCLGFAFRDAKHARNPSPAALRVQLDAEARQVHVLKCRGGLAPAQPISMAS